MKFTDLNLMINAPRDGKFILAYYGGDNWIYKIDPIGVNWVVVYYNEAIGDPNRHNWRQWGHGSFREVDLVGWIPLPRFDLWIDKE